MSGEDLLAFIPLSVAILILSIYVILDWKRSKGG